MRSPLEQESVGAALVTSGQPWRGVEFHDRIGSTNTRLRELLAGAAGTGPDAARLASDAGALWWVVLTDHQVGGRGRLGRAWEVPDRASVAVSVAVPVDDPAAVAWLPLLAGLALARAVRTTTARAGHELRPRLKWPNDLLLPEDEDRKVGGTLCELVQVPRRFGRTGWVVVVGTGVNVDQDRDELPVDTATSLALTGVRVRREDLVVEYLRELAALVPGPSEGAWPAAGERPGSALARREYRSACATLGADVRVHLPTGDPVEGRAVDVDEDGGLVVESAGARRVFAAGDVVHVRRR